MDLDAFDVRILRAIQQAGDLTHAQLAERVHLSPSQSARRLERLRQDGFIDRTVTLLDREKLGLNVLAHVLVSLREHTDERNKAFQQFVEGAPEVLECYMQSGEVDLILKVAVRNLGDLADFIDQMIAITGGVTSLKSSIVLRSIKTKNELAVG